MKKTLSLKLAVWTLLLLAASSAFAWQTPQPFSADMTSTMKNGEKMTGKWYFGPPNMRIDMTSMPQSERGNGAGMFGNMSMIINGSTQTTYMLMPQQQMYVEFHGERQSSMSPGLRNMLHMRGGTDPCTNDPDKTCKKLGTETVNGRSCDKWEVTDKTHGKEMIWMDQKLHFPVRVQGDNGTLTEFTNIKEGAQDASLFKVPAGYKSFDPAAMGRQRRPK